DSEVEGVGFRPVARLQGTNEAPTVVAGALSLFTEEVIVNMQKIVERVREDCFEAHRGAFWGDQAGRLAVAFGNDGYPGDERAQQEVAAVRRLLAEYGGREIGFAVQEEYSWALGCELPERLSPDILEGVLWAAWVQFASAKASGQAFALDWDY